MQLAYSGTFAIEDESITIVDWKAVLLDAMTLEPIASTEISADGANPVEWTIEAEDVYYGFVIVLPLYLMVWAVNTQMIMGLPFIVDSVDLPYVYTVIGTTGTGNSGYSFPAFPTTPGNAITHGECTYLCIGRRPQPQIEGLVWGTVV